MKTRDMFFLISILLILFIFLLLAYKESFIISFVIITLLAMPPEVFPELRPFIHIIDYFLLAFLFFKVYGFDFKKFPSLPKLVVYPLILLFVSMMVSLVFSDYPGAGFQILFRTTAFFILIYLFYGIIRTEKLVNVVLIAFFCTGLILMASVLIDFLLSGRGILYLFNPIRDREYGLNSNVNITGEFAIILFPFVVIAFFIKRYRKRRAWIWLSGLIIVVSVLLIASRAALAGIILSSVIVLFFIERKAFIITSAAAVCALLIYLIFDPLGSTLDFALRMNEGLSSHDQYWEMAWKMIMDHPLSGIGIGAYPLEEFKYFPVMLDTYVGQGMIEIHNLTRDYGSNNSHNFYFVMTSEMGIPGLITALTLLYAFFKICYLDFQKYKEKNPRVVLTLIPIISIGICLALRGIVESNGIFSFGDIKSDLPFWLFFIIIVSYYNDRIGIETEQTALHPVAGLLEQQGLNNLV